LRVPPYDPIFRANDRPEVQILRPVPAFIQYLPEFGQEANFRVIAYGLMGAGYSDEAQEANGEELYAW
jgi:hypothetical protein